MADETKQVMVLCGPYRDNRLTMTAADADSAINNHWAVDPAVLYDPEHEHPPLDDAERQTALDSAHAWAQAQQDALNEEPPPPPEGGITKRRAMKPDEGADYKTRDVPKS
jgi:hypothetical protein